MYYVIVIIQYLIMMWYYQCQSNEIISTGSITAILPASFISWGRPVGWPGRWSPFFRVACTLPIELPILFSSRHYTKTCGLLLSAFAPKPPIPILIGISKNWIIASLREPNRRMRWCLGPSHWRSPSEIWHHLCCREVLLKWCRGSWSYRYINNSLKIFKSFGIEWIMYV